MRKSLLFALAATVFAAVPAAAQSFTEGFFLDGYKLAYKYNPAIQNEGDILSLAQWQGLARSNFGASSFLYPTEGKIVTALHPSVGAEQFLGSLRDDNWLSNSFNFGVASYGWRRGDDYHTLELNVRGDMAAGMPKELFSILKLGSVETAYDLSGLRAFGNFYAEVAYGWSHKVSDWLSFGVRPKLLVGLASADYNVNEFTLSMNGDKYTATVGADLDLTSGWRKIGVSEDGNLDFNPLALSARDRWKLPSGTGLAADMGVLITPVEGLSISLSVLDLGGLLWHYGNAGQSGGTVTFDGVTDLSIEEIQGGELAGQFTQLKDDFLGSLTLKAGEKKGAFKAIPFTSNAAVRWDLPFYRPLSIGATGTYSKMESMEYADGRFVLAWNPCNWLGVTANVGYGSFGLGWGAALTVGCNGFHLNAGLQEDCGGRMPYGGSHLTPFNRILTVGLTYDL